MVYDQKEKDKVTSIQQERGWEWSCQVAEISYFLKPNILHQQIDWKKKKKTYVQYFQETLWNILKKYVEATLSWILLDSKNFPETP